jgi:hypothetical protein
VNEALTSALEEVRLHLEPGLAEAEQELADARQRCRELERALASARDVRDANEALRSPRSLLPPRAVVDERSRRREPGATGGTAPPSPEPSRGVANLPRSWVLQLGRLQRGDPDLLGAAFSKNIIFRWDGNNPLAGTHLGSTRALPVARQLFALVAPGSIKTERIEAANGTVEIETLGTLRRRLPEVDRLQARITSLVRFNDSGRIALWFASPHDLRGMDAFLQLESLAEEPEP